jgi:uncharacterized protein YbjT (DUF2867 family)
VVAGATGYLGRHVVSALAAEGWRVRALARDPARLGDAADACDEVFVGQATDPATLEGLFDGADAAFSSIGVHHFRRRPTFREVDYGANVNLVEAAESAGVGRFVFVSVLAGDVVRHDSPLVDARERVVERLRAGSMAATILRPTGFFNDLAEYLDMARRGRVWLIGDGTSRINPIHGADLAEVVADVLDVAHGPDELSVGGPDVYTQQEIAKLAFAAVGRPVRTGRVPAWLVRGFGRAAGPFNPNLGALLRMFAILAERDAVGDPVGHHHLPDFFEQRAGEGEAAAAAAS